jgi:predicted neutral ceramidase superfamily lipid hydrolase
MTLRQRLKRQSAKLFLAMFSLYTVMVATVLTLGERLNAETLLVFLAIMVTIPFLLLYLWFRCPSCNSSLGTLIGHFGPLQGLGKPVCFCPYCGVQFDSQVAP